MVQLLPDHRRYPDEQLDRPVELPIEHRPTRGLLPALVAAAIIIGAGGWGAMLLLPDVAAPSAGPAPATGPVPAPPPAIGAPATTPAPTGVPARPAPTTLRQQAGADKPAVQKLVGRWVPQISSKAPGLVVDGVSYDEARILAEYRAWRTRYPDVALVRSGDYRSFARPGHWVVLLGRAFSTADAANSWCDHQGFRPDDCFAKRLSRTGGPSGNTVSRR